MRESSQVRVMRESSQVGEMRESSQVYIPHSKDVKILNLYDSATIKDLSGDKPKIYIANDFEIVKFANKNEEETK